VDGTVQVDEMEALRAHQGHEVRAKLDGSAIQFAYQDCNVSMVTPLPDGWSESGSQVTAAHFPRGGTGQAA
jgi:hypothetical protein